MTGHLCRSNTYIKRYETSKFIKLTSRKGNPNGPRQGNGRNRRVTDREPSFRASTLDRKDGTHHEEQLSSNGPSVILSSSPATGTHAGTPPLPAKKSGTGVPSFEPNPSEGGGRPDRKRGPGTKFCQLRCSRLGQQMWRKRGIHRTIPFDRRCKDRVRHG